MTYVPTPLQHRGLPLICVRLDDDGVPVCPNCGKKTGNYQKVAQAQSALDNTNGHLSSREGCREISHSHRRYFPRDAYVKYGNMPPIRLEKYSGIAPFNEHEDIKDQVAKVLEHELNLATKAKKDANERYAQRGHLIAVGQRDLMTALDQKVRRGSQTATLV